MTGPLLETFPLGPRWPTVDPFLFVAHHDDAYPAANDQLGPDAPLSGRDLGMDFSGRDGWSMYHGRVVPGFPQHPHRGFETVTYVRRGLIDHADSLGAAARFGRGDVQWMTAGAGIVHSEMFPLLDQRAPNPVELFQIWLNLPTVDKLVDPHFSMLWDREIPRVGVEGGEVTVIAGPLAGLAPPAPPPSSWAARPDADVAIWHVRIDPGARWTLPAAAPGTIRTIYGFAGGGAEIGAGWLAAATGALVDPTADHPVVAGDGGCELLVLQGRPIAEPVAQYGPFVMNDRAGIERAVRDYQATGFGGWPWPADDPVHGTDPDRFARHADGRIERGQLTPMPAEAWLTLGVLAVAIVVLASERVSPELTLAGSVSVLLLAGVVDGEEALRGFGSEATATIAALYVVAGAASATGALGGVFDRVLDGRRPLLRLVGTTAAASAFVPNTPLVALAAPRLSRWARRSGQPASRFLLPLSFASVLGGVITVLGTSTNLVVSDLLRASGEDRLDVFEVTPIGLPVALAGVAVLVGLGPRLVPDRAAAGDALRSSARRFQVQMIVDPAGALAGRFVGEADLRHLDGVFLAAVERGGQLVPVRPETRLAGGDICLFVGDVDRVLDLHDIPGLTPAEHPHVLEIEGPGTRLFEAVISDQSDLVGSTLRAAGFRSRYGAAVLAIHRPAGELAGKLGTAVLHRGDVLLVLAGPDFETAWRTHHDFALVASSAEPPPPRQGRAWVASTAVVALVGLAATGALTLFEAALVAAAAVLIGGAIDLGEARRAIDVSVVLTVALSIGLGAAVVASGLAAELAAGLAAAGEPLGAVGSIALVVVATQAVTELLSNNAAAAIMLPVALATAAELSADPRAYALAVLIGASCSFLTPIGYQTNLMVYGLGGYRFTDFTRVGVPLTLCTAIVATVMLSILY